MLSPYDLYLQLGDNDAARQRSYRALLDAQLESRELESLRGLLACQSASNFDPRQRRL